MRPESVHSGRRLWSCRPHRGDTLPLKILKTFAEEWILTLSGARMIVFSSSVKEG